MKQLFAALLMGALLCSCGSKDEVPVPNPSVIPSGVPHCPMPSPSPTPTPTSTPSPTGTPSPVDPGLKRVRLNVLSWALMQTDGSVVPQLSEADADTLIAGINVAWAQCNIQFVKNSYEAKQFTAIGLNPHPGSFADLNKIHAYMGDNGHDSLAISGDFTCCGLSPGNAWTTLPGSGTVGAVMEDQVKTMALMAAHELGHSMSLSHVNDQNNLMNPILYSTAKRLSASQCAQARQSLDQDDPDWLF